MKSKNRRTATVAAIVAAAAASYREHELKSWPHHFQPAKAGLKPFEIRYNDRGFQVGDRLRLREWMPLGNGQGRYTGDELLRRVTFMSEPVGIRDGCVALTVEPV